MIILKSNVNTSERNLVDKEKELSKRYKEKVIIIPYGFDYAGRVEQHNG